LEEVKGREGGREREREGGGISASFNLYVNMTIFEHVHTQCHTERYTAC
jgi:hypothetical protein